MADLLSDAQDRYRDALDALREQRQQIEEDLRFSDPSDPQQWDDIEKRNRENDPGGARPCLVMDQCGQYVENVAGTIEQQPPAIHAIPAGDGADKRVAENVDGFFRYVEHASKAQQHYMRALRSAARCGVGYLLVRPEYTDRALGYQEPRITSEGDPLKVVFDPWSVELDGSDATFGQLLTPFGFTEFERQFGKADKVSFGDDRQQRVTDEREQVMTAIEWRVVDQQTNMVFCVDLTGQKQDVFALPEDEFWDKQRAGEVQASPDSAGRSTYNDKRRLVKWVRMSGAGILTPEAEFPADSIGIVPVYGYVGWSDGRMRYCGIPRRARGPQRAYNYHISEVRAYMQTAPKSPWLASTRAVRGLEALWDRSALESRGWLPFNDLDEEGPISPPVRMPVSVNLQNHMQAAEQAKNDIQAAIGMYQANLGAPSNETSGIAIENRKAQGQASTAHFPSHLAASLSQVGSLSLQMVQRLIDTRRQLTILAIDNTPSTIQVDPQQKAPVLEQDNAPISINPCLGNYEVRIVVGASFSTQRQQAQEAYNEMMRNNPQMTPAIAPLWAQTLDVPHADKLAEVLTAIAPDPVKAILDPNAQDSTAKLSAENAQLKQALQEAIQHAKDAQAEALQAQAELHSKAGESQDKGTELAIEAYNAETMRIKALGTALDPAGVQQLVRDTIQSMLMHPDPWPGEHPSAAELPPLPQPAPQPQDPRQAPPLSAAPDPAQETMP